MAFLGHILHNHEPLIFLGFILVGLSRRYYVHFRFHHTNSRGADDSRYIFLAILIILGHVCLLNDYIDLLFRLHFFLGLWTEFFEIHIKLLTLFIRCNRGFLARQLLLILPELLSLGLASLGLIIGAGHVDVDGIFNILCVSVLCFSQVLRFNFKIFTYFTILTEWILNRGFKTSSRFSLLQRFSSEPSGCGVSWESRSESIFVFGQGHLLLKWILLPFSRATLRFNTASEFFI